MSAIKKVTLIEPQPPGYHVYSRFALPRLGLPTLGAILKQKGIDVKIYCPAFEPVDYAEVLSSDMVGISTTTSTAPEGYRIAQKAKEAGIPVIMGGSHVSFMPDEALQYADFCMRGEGEHSLPALVDAINSGSGFSSIPALSYRVGDEIRHNPGWGFVQNLDELPFPDLSLIQGREKIKINPVLTSRGCPFDCNFCSVTKMFGRGYRTRSIESVVEELQCLDSRTVFFYDDNFTADRERTKRLLDRMLSVGVTPWWTAQARVDVVKDKELLRLMKRSHCYVLYLGLESVNPATLKEFNKKQQVEEIVEAVRILHEHSIMIHGMFVLGADTDDVNSVRATLDFARRNKVDTVQFMVLTPLPGTPYFQQMEEQDRLLTREWHLYDGQHVVYSPKKMSPYELQREAFLAMKKFYSLSECARMLLGVDFLKFAAKVNWNILRGRWGSAKLQLEARTRKWFYHFYGHFLVRRWEAANKDIGERMKALAEKARARASTQPPPEKVENNA